MKIEHQAMARTIHRLKAVLLSIVINEEYILFVFEIVTTLHP
jgi:hypothetical protein